MKGRWAPLLLGVGLALLALGPWQKARLMDITAATVIGFAFGRWSR